MAPAPTKDRLPSDTENLTGMPSPDSLANSPCLKPSLSNGHCKQETTFTFPIEDSKGVPEVQTWNPLSGRTKLERRLIVVAIILATCSLTMIVVLFLQWRPEEYTVHLRGERDARKQRSANTEGDMESETAAQSGKKCPTVCTTPNCVASAARLLSNMDDKVDPCDDFYEYSCGGWHRANIIPEDAARYAIPTQLIKTLEIQCKELIERTPPPDEAAAITKARHFYQACMDEAVLDERQNDPVRALIHELDGWPVMGDGVFDETTWNLEDVLAKSRLKIDRNFIFKNYVSVDAKNSSLYILALDQPGLGLENRDYFLQNSSYESLVAYENYMIEMTLELRSDGNEAEVRRQMQDVLNFEKKLAEISISTADRRRAYTMYHKITVAQLQYAVPVVDWMRYFRYVLNTTHLDDTMEVVLYSPQYLDGLNRVLTETPTSTIANYLMWRSVIYTIDQLSSRARGIRQTFQKVVSGEEREATRFKQCVDSTNHFMGLALGALFVQEHFDDESKQKAYEMIGHLRGSLYTILNMTEWMDDDTKENALEKAYAIRERIGYDERILNHTFLNSKYENIDIRRDKFFENALEIWSDHAVKSFAKLQEPVDRYSWPTPPVVVNAYYQFTSNQIIFPAAILQPPYFSRQYSRSMNYGGIGVVIGHELMHGFDDRGRLFDKDGNMKYWWSESSSEAFGEKATCLVGQYSNYSFEDLGLNVNGRQTLGENIADNGGLKEAFMAYRHSVEHGQGEEPLLPGVNLTHNQIFFLSFGQLWCGLHRDQDKLNSIKSDYHSPLKFRVWGTVSNSEEFAEAFNCPAGSPMNPRKKCSVW